jgi:hypothetical protein
VLQWEKLESSAFHSVRRTKVPGGWLVFIHGINGDAGGLAFYPDPTHAWDGTSGATAPKGHHAG